jgi:chromate transporter
MNQLPAVARLFAYLSLLTVGGGMAAFPEMKTLTVDGHHGLSFPELIHLYSVGQMAPGTNMMMIVPIGDWAAGPVGAIAGLPAFFGPSALLAFFVGRLRNRLEPRPWRVANQQGLAPGWSGCCWPDVSSWRRGPSLGWRPRRSQSGCG